MAEIYQRDVNGARFFQAEEGGTTKGFAVSSLGNDGQLILDSIHVVPPARGKGIGSALLSAVFDWGKEKGASEITGDFYPEFKGGNDEKAAREFYRKHGVEICSDGKLKRKI